MWVTDTQHIKKYLTLAEIVKMLADHGYLTEDYRII